MSNSELPKSWKECKLGEISTDISYGYTASATFENTGTKFLRITDIVPSRINWKNVPFCEVDELKKEKYKLDVGDLVIARTGATTGYNKVIKDSKDAVFASYLIRYKLDKSIVIPNYIGYYLQSEIWDGFVGGIKGGSAQPGANAKQFASFEINLPPLAEQKAIAEVLSSLDDKIDLLHQQNQTLEDMAQTLFREWFVEKADEGWGEVPLSEVADFLNGLACQKFPPKNDIDKLPVLKIKDLKAGISDSSDWASNDVDSKYIIENGDVIFSWSASLVVKIWDGEKCILNQHLFKVTSENYPKWFYYQWCKYHLDRFISISQAHATTMGHIKRKDLDNALCFVPSDNVLENMNKKIQPIIEKLEINQKQIKTLEQTRDTLLPKLMSGQVRV